ncbi:hypothetical protein ACNSPR_27990 [Klebsiella pneumoniae]
MTTTTIDDEPIGESTEADKSLPPKLTSAIELKDLKRLMDAGAVQSIVLEGTSGGFLMRVRLQKGKDGLLYERRGQPRVFRLAQTAVALAKSLGMNRVEFRKLGEWRPEEQPLF